MPTLEVIPMRDTTVRIPEHQYRAIDLIKTICGVAGSLTFLDDIQTDARKAGILKAVAENDSPKIFDWLLGAFSYQGISDQVARGYIRKHGNVTWSDVLAGLDAAQLPPPCPLLQTYWHFDGCDTTKAASAVHNLTTSTPARYRAIGCVTVG